MTPTEQAADRVKALVERLRAPDEFNNRGPDYEPMIIPPSALRLEAADALTALQARAEDAERENERLSARNLEVSTLAHGWMVAHDNLAAGLPVTYPSPADVPASLFVCALMAAAAETTYRIGFRDAERVTDERHIDYLRGNTIAGIAAAMQAPDADLTARVETLQARVGELEGALKPLLSCLDDIETYQRRPERGDWGVECAWPHKAEAVPTRTPQVSHEFREAKQNNPSPTTGADQ